jgi:Trk K+ transport system NAD-binding subunit
VERPIFICGLGRMGSRVLECLHTAGLPVVVISTQCQPDDPRLRQVPLVMGDFRSRTVMEKAGIARARAVFILTRDDLLNISTALQVRSLNPDARIVLRLFNPDLLSRLEQAIDNVFALSTSLLVGPLLALTASTGQGLAAFRLDGQDERHIIELAVPDGSSWCGRSTGTLQADRNVLVLGHLPVSGPCRYLQDLDPRAPLRGGDRMVICAAPERLAALAAEVYRGREPPLLWARWHRRMMRVLQRTWREIDPAVLICTSVLVAVVFTSTLVLHLGVERYSLADALFRTISVMATGAQMDDENLIGHPGMKVFLSLLRLLGMALMAAYTAIVTNYLLRARLGGAFEVRRIPDGGHVIVCGLGATGYRTVEELIHGKQRVVAIENDANSRFVRQARKIGAAVMIGDASLPDVLREAHAATAHAVIAVTDNDLTNLAVALLVRQWRPGQRVVLVLEDPQLARMLREAARVQLALSVPLLAAPAFLTALYGNRVLSVFQMSSSLFAVLDLYVQAQDPFVGQSLEKAAAEYRLSPVAAWSASGQPLPAGQEGCLEAGSRLVAILALPDLEALLRSQQAVPAG